VTSDVEHFASLGMTPEEAESRAALLRQADERGRAFIGGAPRWRWFVPGRIEIFGKHTDYAGGRSLLAAVPRGMAIIARPRGDGIVRLTDVFDGREVSVDPSQEAPPNIRGLRRYLHVVARRFFLNFPGCRLGADLAIASDLPRAAGLSSSSALVCAVAAALARRAALTDREEWQAHIPSRPSLAWYLGCVENGLTYPGLPGTSGVGTRGGSQDHTAILACRLHHVSQFRFVPVLPIDEVAMPADWTFVVASSGVQADKAGSVMHRYNRAADRARVLHDLWNARADQPERSVGAALSSAPDALDALRSWITDEVDARFTADDLLRRLQHFVNEDARAPLAARAFGAADATTLGRLSHDSQYEADDLLGNQIPETIRLAAAAREAGAFAASSFGAGFGGSVWALIPTTDAKPFVREWLRAYDTRVPDPPLPCFIARPGPPLTELPTDAAQAD